MSLANGCALAIRDAFADYHARFAQITRRARTHFEARDWGAARADAVARIALYDRCVQEISQALEGLCRPDGGQGGDGERPFPLEGRGRGVGARS